MARRGPSPTRSAALLAAVIAAAAPFILAAATAFLAVAPAAAQDTPALTRELTRVLSAYLALERS